MLDWYVTDPDYSADGCHPLTDGTVFRDLDELRSEYGSVDDNDEMDGFDSDMPEDWEEDTDNLLAEQIPDLEDGSDRMPDLIDIETET